MVKLGWFRGRVRQLPSKQIYVICGPPASGKSTFTRHLSRELYWRSLFRVRPRILGTDTYRRPLLPGHLRTTEEKMIGYRKMANDLRECLKQKGPAIILLDGTFHLRAFREVIESVAQAHGALLRYIRISAPLEQRIQWLKTAEQQGRNRYGSEMTSNVLEGHGDRPWQFEPIGEVYKEVENGTGISERQLKGETKKVAARIIADHAALQRRGA